jgi:hypothetical protein
MSSWKEPEKYENIYHDNPFACKRLQTNTYQIKCNNAIRNNGTQNFL